MKTGMENIGFVKYVSKRVCVCVCVCDAFVLLKI